MQFKAPEKKIKSLIEKRLEIEADFEEDLKKILKCYISGDIYMDKNLSVLLNMQDLIQVLKNNYDKAIIKILEEIIRIESEQKNNARFKKEILFCNQIKATVNNKIKGR